jgi:hypothetical protein
MICRTEPPGKFNIYSRPIGCPNSCLVGFFDLRRWTCDQPLGTAFLLRCLDDLFSLGLITNTVDARRSAVAGRGLQPNARHQYLLRQCFHINMNIPGPVLTAGHRITRLGYLPITISRSWLGDHATYLGRVTVLYLLQHAGATHATSVVHVFRSINFCCDILPTHSEKQTNGGSHSAPLTTLPLPSTLSVYKTPFNSILDSVCVHVT